MADASFYQPQFQGGELAPFFQGRLDDPSYRMGLNVCRNSMPLEEGGWARRSGFRFCAPTWQGQPAVLKTFHFNQANPYTIELTDQIARIFNGPSLVLDGRHNVLAVSSANPAVIQTNEAHTWATGDEVVFFRNATDTNFTPGLLLQRWFQITVVDSTHFSIADAVTGAPFDGSTVTLGTTSLGVGRVLHLASPYSSKGTAKGIDKVNLVQGPNFVLLLHPAVPPQIVATQVQPSDSSQGVFAFQSQQLSDGPYLDTPTDGSQVTPSGTSGSITLTQTLNVYDPTHTYAIGDVVNFNGLGYTSLIGTNLNNQPDISSSDWQLNVSNTSTTQAGFLPTDVGRSIRFFSEPPAYNAGTAYTVGQLVKWQGAYWAALGSTTGNQPDISPTQWQVSPGAAVWSWGIITAYGSAGSVTVNILGGNLLNTNSMIYRLGVYSDTTGWPTTGAYQEGRLWLGGVLPNRVDGSYANQPFNFQPTLVDGTVTDANGIAAPFQSETNNAVYWMVAENQGIVVGTKGGEYVVQASNLNDPLTPSSTMVRRTTKFGAANVVPVRGPMAVLFAQRHNRKLIEYIADVYTSKFSGTNLARKASHMTQTGIQEMVFQQEVVPTVWLRMGDGSLKGLLYKRESPFGTQPAEFVGWHRHDHGQGRTFESLQSGPSMNGGDTDTIMVVTSDGSVRWVEMMANQFESGDDVTQGWFVDGGMPATAGEILGGNTLKLAGYYYNAGKTIDFQIAGLDMQTATVAADGTVSIPFGNNPVMTTAYLATVAARGLTYDTQAVVIPVSATAGLPDITGISMFNQIDGLHALAMNYNAGAFDWDNNQALIAALSSDVMQKYRITTGFEFTYQSSAKWDSLLLTSWNPPVYDTHGLSFPGTMTAGNGIAIWPQANLFFIPGSGSNNQFLRIGNLSGLTPVTNAYHVAARVGVNDGGLATNGSIPGSGELVALTAGSRHYALTIPVYNLGAGQLNMIDIDASRDVSPTGGSPVLSTLNFGHKVNGENCYYIRGVAGYQSTTPFYNYAEACLVGHTVPGIGVQNNIIPLFIGKAVVKGEANGTTTSFVLDNGTVSPSAVQNIPGVNIDGIWAPIYDPSDGNIITAVHLDQVPTWNSGLAYTTTQQVIGSNGHAYAALSGTTAVDPTTDGGVHWQDLGASSVPTHQWLLKVNPATAAVVWKTALPATSLLQGDASYNQYRLGMFKTLVLAPGDGNMYTVATDTGVMTNIGSIDHIGTIFGQAWDAFTGRMVISCNYNTASGTHGPAPINATPSSFNQTWAAFGGVPGTITNYTFMALGGGSFISQGQLLRELTPEESGARNGPALGKTRRLHEFALLLGQTQGIQVGTNFTDQIETKTLAAYENGPALPAGTLFNGVLWDTVPDDYSYDGLLCWQVTRPYPANVMSAQGFLHTQDR